MKYLIIFFAVLCSYWQSTCAKQIDSVQSCESQHSSVGYRAYRIKDIGETAYFLIEKLRECRLLARTIIMNAKTLEILSDKSTGEFIHTLKTRRAYCSFVEPFIQNRLPAKNVLWFSLVDPKGCAVHICTFDAHGNYIDLRPLLFPCEK